MDNKPDFHGSSEFDPGDTVALTAWLATYFPQIAVSFGPPEDDFLTVCGAWCQAGGVEEFLEYQTRFACGMDKRTKGAHLLALYSHQLAVAAGAMYLLAGLLPDLFPDQLRMRFEPHDRSANGSGVLLDAKRFHFRFTESGRIADSASAFHDGFVKSIEPVIAALHAHTGLSLAAQWRLAADGLAGAFLDIGRAAGKEEKAMAAAIAIIGQEESPLFSDALRFERVEGLRDGLAVSGFFRLRSGCCLYYRTDGGDFCDVCVLLERKEQKRRLRAHLERLDVSL